MLREHWRDLPKEEVAEQIKAMLSKTNSAEEKPVARVIAYSSVTLGPDAARSISEKELYSFIDALSHFEPLQGGSPLIGLRDS